MIGRRLQDSYEIARVIGRGATGTVYEARALASGESVAIKWLHARPFAQDDPDLRRFTQEARIAGRLDSPHVTRILELSRDPETGVPFQVMELLRGEDARSLLDRVGPLAPGAALRIAAQACLGLAAAHAAGVVHRDVKPENLFLARAAGGGVVVKVLDFGVAKIRRAQGRGAPGAVISRHSASMTESGQIMGTPLFMSPEQIDGARHVDARSDVYSVGVTLYALLAGAPPHAGVKSVIALLHALVNEPAPPLALAAPWVPAGVVAVVERAMSQDREQRPRDAAELFAALQPLLPEGTELREDMLSGAGERERAQSCSSAIPRRP